MPTICLNMIVKNESRIITRLLDSVVQYIDSYCICDTGSSDNTPMIIENYFNAKQIPGKVFSEPFQNFEYNRTFALEQCKLSNTDYVLLLDADMIFVCNLDVETFKKALSTHDCFYIFQGSDQMYYKNTRIVRNNGKCKYIGVTHEYVSIPDEMTQGMFAKEHVFINDIGDGGAKSDKFVRDVRLLKQGLVNDPMNVRYMFYLANSLKDLAHVERHDTQQKIRELKDTMSQLQTMVSSYTEDSNKVQNIIESLSGIKKNLKNRFLERIHESISWYKKRIECGGFWEEIWYSYYNIGNLFMELKEYEKAVYYYYQGYTLFPQRVENLYKIVNYYRSTGQNVQAVHYYMLAKQLLEKQTNYDYLFIERDIYDYKLDFEMSIVGYYHNPKNYPLDMLSMKVLNQKSMDFGIANNVLCNYKFYAESLHSYDTCAWKEHHWGSVLLTIGDDLNTQLEGFYKSSPTFCFLDGTFTKMLGIVRYVNYFIDENGGYVQQDSIETRNVIATIELDEDKKEWHIVKQNLLQYNTQHDGLYVGIEDMRIFRHQEKVYYSGNRGFGYGDVKVEHGYINTSTLETCDDKLMTIPNQQSVEKNWILFSNEKGDLQMVYKWFPLTIGNVVDNQFIKHSEIQTPCAFKYFRGSTNGIIVGDKIWFLCHVVSYEERRYYYHVMVALDKETFQLKHYSKMFTFKKEKVEYCLGMGFDPESEEFTFAISVYDRQIHCISIPEQWFIDHRVM